MTLVGRLVRNRQVRAAASEALRTNLPLVEAPLASLPPAWPARPCVPALGDEYLMDLWPEQLRDERSDDYAKLYNHFRWIAEGAGRKLYELDNSVPAPRERAHASGRIVEEARAFAEVAVESLLKPSRSVVNSAAADSAAESASESVPVPSAERPRDWRDRPRDGTEGEQARLEQIVGFVARQEPKLCWAVGYRPNGAIVLACDLAFGWIPPRVALPAVVELLAPAARGHMEIEDLLGDVTLCTVVRPGGAVAEATELMSLPSPTASPVIPGEELIGHLIRNGLHRSGTAPVVRVINSPSAGPGAAIGRQGIAAHVDAARRQLLSDYPLLDESVLGDCLLLCALESCLIGDTAAATYHYRWFEALYDGS